MDGLVAGAYVALATVVKRIGAGSIGLLLILHGLAHIASGTSAQDVPQGAIAAFLGGGVAEDWTATTRVILVTILFALALPGFVAAGLGYWMKRGVFVRFRRLLVAVASVASFILLAFCTQPSIASGIGLFLDTLILALFFAVASTEKRTHANTEAEGPAQ